ncbi:hypothetical protein GCM10009672_18620 [Nesterenkonia lutea]
MARRIVVAHPGVEALAEELALGREDDGAHRHVRRHACLLRKLQTPADGSLLIATGPWGPGDLGIDVLRHGPSLWPTLPRPVPAGASLKGCW